MVRVVRVRVRVRVRVLDLATENIGLVRGGGRD